MSQNSHPNKPSKHSLRDAQARHQSALFGGQAPKPSAQRAETESRQRSQALDQAAAQKRQQLTPKEAQKLAELQAKSQSAREAAQSSQPPSAQAPTAPPQTNPAAAPQAVAGGIHHASRRNDLAAEALANMQRNLKRTPPPQKPSTSHAPTQPPVPTPPPAEPTPPTPPPPPSPSTQPPAQPQPRADVGTPPPRPRGSRPAPNPEELDRLLREMAQRSAARRSASQPSRGAAGVPPRPAGAPARPYGGAPGAERGESMPTAEAPPEPPPEVQAEEEKSVEKQAEILRELKAKEAAAQQDIRPIPQADQERAEERPVEATVPIQTEGNAVNAAPLHAAIADLQTAMRAHDAPGQVEGVNEVQRTMPNHPLYQPGQDQGGSHGA